MRVTANIAAALVVVALCVMPAPGHAFLKNICCTGSDCSKKSSKSCRRGGGKSLPLTGFESCTSSTCDTTLPDLYGACQFCDKDKCSHLGFLGCLISGGRWTKGVTCSAAPPCESDLPATVACCDPETAGCEDVPAGECAGTAGAEGSLCATTMCTEPDRGSCCVPGGACFNDATAKECMAAGGAWNKDGVCEDDTCECKIGQCAAGTVCVLGECLDAEMTGKEYATSTYNTGDWYVAGEAEDFSARCFHNSGSGTGDYFWAVVPDTTSGLRACGGTNIEVRPDNTISSAVLPDVISPIVDYTVNVADSGRWNLWVRAAKFDGKSDSVFAEIVELRESGVTPLWWRIAPTSNTIQWLSGGGFESTSAGGGNSNMYFDFPSPGTYTLRFHMREDGTPVDSWALVRDLEDGDEFTPSACSLPSTCLEEGDLPGTCPVELALCTDKTASATSPDADGCRNTVTLMFVE